MSCINLPGPHAELSSAFSRYEAALTTNDTATLDAHCLHAVYRDTAPGKVGRQMQT